MLKFIKTRRNSQKVDGVLHKNVKRAPGAGESGGGFSGDRAPEPGRKTGGEGLAGPGAIGYNRQKQEAAVCLDLTILILM